MEDFYLQAEHLKAKSIKKGKSDLSIETSSPCSQNQQLEKSPRAPKLQVLPIPPIVSPCGEALRAGQSPSTNPEFPGAQRRGEEGPSRPRLQHSLVSPSRDQPLLQLQAAPLAGTAQLLFPVSGGKTKPGDDQSMHVVISGIQQSSDLRQASPVPSITKSAKSSVKAEPFSKGCFQPCLVMSLAHSQGFLQEGIGLQSNNLNSATAKKFN